MLSDCAVSMANRMSCDGAAVWDRLPTGGSRAGAQRFTVMHRGVSVDSISHLMKAPFFSFPSVRQPRCPNLPAASGSKIFGRFNSLRNGSMSIRTRPS